MRALNLTGQRFGRLTATECLGSIKGRRYWAVKCDCGNEEIVLGTTLKNGHTKSCGCLHRDTITTHGKSKKYEKPPEYLCWVLMRTRNDDVLCEWNDFQQFFSDIGMRPSRKHRLTRRDVRKPHGPNNTYWKDPLEKTPTHADLGDEFFLDMRRAFTGTTETTEERTRAKECVLR